MLQIHIEDAWDTFEKHVYVLERTPQGTGVFKSSGEVVGWFPVGTSFMNEVEPTYIIRDNWLEPLLEELAPQVPKVEQFVYDTVKYDRSIIDRLLNDIPRSNPSI